MKLKIVYLENYNGGRENEKLKYAKHGDSGFDLRAAKDEDGMGYWLIPPNKAVVIPTGIKVAVPYGFEMQVRTRSGSPLKSDFFIANSPGTVDCITKNTLIVTDDGEKSLEILLQEDNPTCISYNTDTDNYETDEITEIWNVGNKEVLRIETEDGNWFECTKNQLVLTKSGKWKIAANLTIDDELM